MRLLIVDDEEATCQGMRVRVQSMNLPALTDIDLAFSAEEALALAQKKEVLLLLTDIRMVDMDGLQLIEELKKQNPCLCSVIMTAHPQFEYAHQAIRLGVTDFLLKTFTREELQKALMQAIDQVLRLQENMRNEQQHVSENTPPVEWAKRYVQEHIQQDIDMSYIANCLNLSYSYFSKLFRQETGTNFSSYVVEEKMKAAGKMLREGRRTSEVAELLGYEATQNFSRAFTKYWRCTPGEYRKQ